MKFLRPTHPGFHFHKHGAPLWSMPHRRTLADQRPSWSLGDDNLHRRSDVRGSSLPLSSTGPHRKRWCEAGILPPYSPDSNPIENAFSKLKALLREAAERFIESLWTTIGRLFQLFNADECRNYFAGYDAA